MADNGVSPILRIQVLAVSIVGAVAVLCFVISLLTSGGLSDGLRTTAGIAAGAGAVIGVTFVFTGRTR